MCEGWFWVIEEMRKGMGVSRVYGERERKIGGWRVLMCFGGRIKERIGRIGLKRREGESRVRGEILYGIS